MKLTQEHIGKRVRRVGGNPVCGTLLAVWQENDYYMLGEGWQEGDNLGLGTWELVDEEPQGLSLLEAMQSGREFRPIDLVTFSPKGQWLCYTYETSVRFVMSDRLLPIDTEVLSARYELKPEPNKVEVTAEKLREIFAGLNSVEWIITKLGLGE